MRPLLTIVAVVCVAQLMLGSSASSKPVGEDKLSSEEIARRLSSVEFTPEQTLALLRKQDPAAVKTIYKGLVSANGFLRIVDEASCEQSDLDKMNRFSVDLENWFKQDQSLLHKNLVSFTRFYADKRVKDCADREQFN